jgi:hypothetical protein
VAGVLLHRRVGLGRRHPECCRGSVLAGDRLPGLQGGRRGRASSRCGSSGRTSGRSTSACGRSR